MRGTLRRLYVTVVVFVVAALCLQARAIGRNFVVTRQADRRDESTARRVRRESRGSSRSGRPLPGWPVRLVARRRQRRRLRRDRKRRWRNLHVRCPRPGPRRWSRRPAARSPAPRPSTAALRSWVRQHQACTHTTPSAGASNGPRVIDEGFGGVAHRRQPSRAAACFVSSQRHAVRGAAGGRWPRCGRHPSPDRSRHPPLRAGSCTSPLLTRDGDRAVSDGTVAWTTPLPGTSPTASTSRRTGRRRRRRLRRSCQATGTTTRCFALDAATGAVGVERATRRSRRRRRSPTVVYVGSAPSQTLEARRVADGSLVWAGPSAMNLLLAGGRRWCRLRRH